MNTPQSFALAAVLLVAPQAAQAQSNISAAHARSWSENCGWMDWRTSGSPAGAQGVRVGSTSLSGFIWCENVGFINLGGGAPANGVAYANADGADFGVNRAPDGALSGLAWGENIGWINFSAGALASPPNPARTDLAAHRLRGYAWGENTGWINLDDPTAFVGFDSACPCDWNNSGGVTIQDIFDFLTSFFSDAADINSSGATTVQDVFDFLTCYFSGCQ